MEIALMAAIFQEVRTICTQSLRNLRASLQLLNRSMIAARPRRPIFAALSGCSSIQRIHRASSAEFPGGKRSPAFADRKKGRIGARLLAITGSPQAQYS